MQLKTVKSGLVSRMQSKIWKFKDREIKFVQIETTLVSKLTYLWRKISSKMLQKHVYLGAQKTENKTFMKLAVLEKKIPVETIFG